MRQQNNNNNNNKNRMRGRGRNQNNKPSNSINRNYESNGPDVKIRGNAAHIAEKYATLARDALSSGDRVVAENYLQHAEHYNRIVFAANAQREEQLAAQAAQRGQQSDEAGNEQPQVEASEGNSDNSENGADNQDRRPRRRDSRGESRNNNKARQREVSSGDVSAEADANVEAVNGTNGSVEVEAVVPVEVKPAAKPKTRRTSRKKDDAAEKITEDAAGLPQGLLGGGASSEVTATDE